jgi:hypothetical protein
VNYPGEPLVDALERKAAVDDVQFPPFADPTAGRTPSSEDIKWADEPLLEQDERPKYMVFKIDDWENWVRDNPLAPLPQPVHDFVVIRLQDVFAAPALDAYANSIQVAVRAMQMDAGGYNETVVRRLSGIADYFHEMATRARDEDGFTSKIPD